MNIYFLCYHFVVVVIRKNQNAEHLEERATKIKFSLYLYMALLQPDVLELFYNPQMNTLLGDKFVKNKLRMWDKPIINKPVPP